MVRFPIARGFSRGSVLSSSGLLAGRLLLWLLLLLSLIHI